MVYSNGSAANQTYGETISVDASLKYYYTGNYVNMNSVGVNPQIQYLAQDGTYKNYDTEMFYDSDRYYFEMVFETPEDALITNGRATVRVQINNLNKGKGYFTELMFTEDGKHINLLSNLSSSGSNYKFTNYDSGVFVFYYDDEKFDDGDWSGELSNNAYEVKYGIISGKIVDKNGLPLKGIKLKLDPSGKTAVTDEYGNYELSNLAPGKYKLYLVENEESELFCLEVNVQKGIASMLPAITYSVDDGTVEYNPADYGILRGYYYDQTGKLLPGGKIFLRGYDSVVTDKNGMFSFEDIKPGEYELYTVLEDGSEYVFRKVNIEKGKGIQVKIMEPIIEEEESNLWIILLIVGIGVFVAGIISMVIILVLKKKSVKI